MNQMVSSVLSVGLAQETRAESVTRPVDGAFRQLREEYQAQQQLFDAQPLGVQRFLQEQAAHIAEALVQRQRQIQFVLPEQVMIPASVRNREAVPVPPEFRKQTVAGLLGHFPVKDIRTAVRQRLAQLEQTNHAAIAVSARLLRYATVRHMVRDRLPSGDPKACLDDSEVMPAFDLPASAARRFFLPEWVAFDEGRLLVDTIDEAETRVALMQNYVSTLHLAVSLAPYIFADEEYQRKRCGMLAQLVNQGRALARYQISIIVGKIQRYAEAGDLNRGFSLSLPYFDDQTLEMKMHDFQVIPAGRTMFVPAFVVLAARREQDQVLQDTHLSQSTRMHVLSELKALERAFESSEL